jgi:hypothetical protein
MLNLIIINMKKDYIKNEMSSLYKTLVLVLLSIFTVSSKAANIDLGEIELGKKYELEMFKGYVATFTAPKTGTIICQSTTGDFLEPFKDSQYSSAVPTQFLGYNNGQQRQFDVTEGTTYYLLNDFVMDNTTLTFNYVGEDIEIVSVTPQENTMVDISGKGQINIQFNMGVTAESVTVNSNGQTVAVGTVYPFGSNIMIPLRGEAEGEMNLVSKLLDGTLKKGDKLVFTLEVSATKDESIKKTVSLEFVCQDRPATLVETKQISKFLSYRMPVDEAGLMSLTFTSDLLVPADGENGAIVTMQYGNPESGDPNECYVETIPVRIEGNKLIADFTGKLRNPANMVASGVDYGSVLVKVVNIKDKDGNYIYTGNDGSLGSYSFNIPYEEIKADVYYEYTPGYNSNIAVSVEKIELWISGYKNVRFSGVVFEYPSEYDSAEMDTVIISNEKLEVTIEETDASFVFSIPEEVRGRNNVKVSLLSPLFVDGIARDITATYNFEGEENGILDKVNSEVVNTEYIGVDGLCLTSPKKGLSIVRKTLSNGDVIMTKVYIK